MRRTGLADRLTPFLTVVNSPFCWPNYISTCLLLCDAVRIAIILNLKTASRNLINNYTLSEIFLFWRVVCQIGDFDSSTQLRYSRSQASFVLHSDRGLGNTGSLLSTCVRVRRQQTPFLDRESWLNDHGDKHALIGGSWKGCKIGGL